MRRALVLLVPTLLVGGVVAQDPALEVPNYAVGDNATADIVTPVPLVVFDASRTEEIRRAEGRKVSPVIRHVPAETGRAEADLRRAFSGMRKSFAEELERAFQHGPPLLNSELSQPQFTEVVQAFTQQNKLFPLSRQLAELWALDDNGDLVVETMVAGLRRWNARYLLDAELPRNQRSTSGNVRLVAADSSSSALNLAQVDKGRNLARTNLQTIEAVRKQALTRAVAGESNSLQFALGFLRPTSFFEPELTERARERRVETINAADHYAPGDLLVAKGETISPRSRLALDELRTRTEARRLETAAARERTAAETAAARAREAASAAMRVKKTNQWLIGGLAGVGFVCLLLGVLLWKRRLQMRALSGNTALVPVGSADWSGDWQQRAAAAEARAEKAAGLLRTQMLPQLARSLMGEMFRRLWTQRTISQSANVQAELEVAQLARRLEELQAPLQERLQAYQQRIAELEAELAMKGRENQALIQAKIESTRKMLEGERNLEGANWQ